ncbi:uncharacterized protein BDZ99DRAFT_558199 [Mytilinidion resinicola]|uniref:Zn(2)-C6 fungal-type domain-containing protein n=1 Tax=Mytilinidion resinicola TaxID=574789 RepID=A0A6A6YVA3_9PEZI|nr:uncharacterized protein BDZ99DRAFT_558199 [Mytilinidion resinicola]KAF2812313.1 hypothetical protein BDZ99DRAFT_558199 [Mytilinidion resinicola]
MTKRSHKSAIDTTSRSPDQHATETSHKNPSPQGDSNQGKAASEDGQDGGDFKRPRTFMATLACDTCRIKKTRCDEDRPKCGQCKSRGLSTPCVYPEPRVTKKDQSMSVAINAIRRLESKIEDLTSYIHSSPKATLITQVVDQTSPQSVTSATLPARSNSLLVHDAHETINDLDELSPGTNDEGHPLVRRSSLVGSLLPISFSQHRVLRWPAIKQLLPPNLLSASENLIRDYLIELETHRPPLTISIIPYPLDADERWLSKLPLSLIKGLADAYFAVFNRNTPVLDKFHFFTSTLGIAMENDFGYDIETCLVLNVLTLGCLAVKAYQEGDYSLPGQGSTDTTYQCPEWHEVFAEDPPGLRFFNEARKRTGFLLCDNDLQNAQFYVLSGVYYTQIVRPIDSWTMFNRAALCCLTLLKRNQFGDYDSWEGDMKSRVFWNILMYETILIQELNLPLSGLAHYEADVPIPKFTPFPRPRMESGRLASLEDDSFFNFHFLAQVAHRIILTRIRHSLYFYSEKGDFPPPAITSELQHQLDQWRTNLPPALQFALDDDDAERPPSPAHVVAKAMLKGRYLVAKFHASRPFLYKALHSPNLATDGDLWVVQDGLKAAMHWPATIGLCRQMRSSQPLKFGWCSQFFGQILQFYGVAHCSDQRLRQTLPVGWEDWTQEMMEMLEHCAPLSPGIAKDLELLRLL